MPDWVVAIFRMAQFTSGAALVGVPLFALYAAQSNGSWLNRVMASSLICSVLSGAAVAVLHASALLGTDWYSLSAADLWWYLDGTRIGQVVLGRFALLILLLRVAPRQPRQWLTRPE